MNTGRQSWLPIFIITTLLSCSDGNKHPTKPFLTQSELGNFVDNSRADTADVEHLQNILKLQREDSTTLRNTIALLEKGFADPNSRYRNELLTAELLKEKLQSKWYLEQEKRIARKMLHLLQQNNIGTPANDFTYITPDGKKKTLYDVRANKLLVFFYNPECEACKEYSKAISNSKILTAEGAEKNLKIVAVYIGKDRSIWKKHLFEFPNQWIHGRDEDEHLYKNGVYDLRAIPTIYLLDSDKKVMLKDCMDIRLIEQALTK